MEVVKTGPKAWVTGEENNNNKMCPNRVTNQRDQIWCRRCVCNGEWPQFNATLVGLTQLYVLKWQSQPCCQTWGKCWLKNWLPSESQHAASMRTVCIPTCLSDVAWSLCSREWQCTCKTVSVFCVWSKNCTPPNKQLKNKWYKKILVHGNTKRPKKAKKGECHIPNSLFAKHQWRYVHLGSPDKQ